MNDWGTRPWRSEVLSFYDNKLGESDTMKQIPSGSPGSVFPCLFSPVPLSSSRKPGGTSNCGHFPLSSLSFEPVFLEVGRSVVTLSESAWLSLGSYVWRKSLPGVPCPCRTGVTTHTRVPYRGPSVVPECQEHRPIKDSHCSRRRMIPSG